MCWVLVAGKHPFKVGAVHHVCGGIAYLLLDSVHILSGLQVKEDQSEGTCAPIACPGGAAGLEEKVQCKGIEPHPPAHMSSMLTTTPAL